MSNLNQLMWTWAPRCLLPLISSQIRSEWWVLRRGCYQRNSSMERVCRLGLHSFEPCDARRQHQTRIKSTNSTDPGWPGRLLTALVSGECSVVLGRETEMKGGKEVKWDKMDGGTLKETALQKGLQSSHSQSSCGSCWEYEITNE